MDDSFTHMDHEQERARTERNGYEPNPWLEHIGWERHLHSDCRRWITEFVKAAPNASKVQEFLGEDEERFCARPRKGIIASMRGYDVVDPPFVPDQSGRGRRVTCIALHQSTRERCTEQRQAILRQAEDQDNPKIRQRVHTNIEVHLEDGGHARAAQISIDRSPEAGISTIAARSVRTSIDYRAATSERVSSEPFRSFGSSCSITI
jgi:hypothetical protein